jgi:beta-galactosidase
VSGYLPSAVPDPIIPSLPSIAFGGDYNPEQWDETVWLQDIDLMQRAGVNLVSVGIFSWAFLEPEPGHYELEMLERIVDLLHGGGIRVNLANATASPPAWMARLHPETLPVASDGTVLGFGSRQQYCPSSPVFREAVAALTDQIGSRFAGHPALAMWHVNNEYGCHVSECFCDVSRHHFRRWLNERYTTIDRLNEAWGTAFWSQRYRSFDEVAPPAAMPTFSNPSQLLDWRRFGSDTLIELFQLERDILRRHAPGVPITTNFLGMYPPIDYWKMAAEEDVVSQDSYPDPFDTAGSTSGAAAVCDLVRSLGAGRPWILMEQAASSVQWRARNGLKRPGQMRAQSLQAVGRGADGVMFFQWRQSVRGAERFHSGMVPHAGTDTRVWREIEGLGADLARLGPLIGTTVTAEAAIVFDWECWWSHRTDVQPGPVDYPAIVADHHRALWERSITADFVQPLAALDRYRLVIAPALFRMSDEVEAWLTRFVESGGTLLLTHQSGIVDGDDRVRTGGYLAGLPLGMWVEEFDVQPKGRTLDVRTNDRKQFAGLEWRDVIRPTGAEVLAESPTPHFPGPVVTRHRFGSGHAWYLGTRFDAEGLAWLTDKLLSAAGLKPPFPVPPGVELVIRTDGTNRFHVLINHGDAETKLSLPAPMRDLLTDTTTTKTIRLAPQDVAVLVPLEPAREHSCPPRACERGKGSPLAG